MYETIDVTTGPVTTVSLNRPEVRNAFNALMIEELTHAFRGLAIDTEVRVVVLRGNGPLFSAGADVNWMRDSLDFSEEENLADARRMSDMFQAINVIPKPVLCCVHGAALGGGMGLMAVCDIVVAASDATFGFTEAKLGIIPAVISRFVLPRTGESWARALFLTAERFGPDVARRIGLVHWIADPDDIDELMAGKVREILSSGPAAVAEAKALVFDAGAADRDQLRDLTAERIAGIRAGPEGQEGLRAFLEKRPASWRDER